MGSEQSRMPENWIEGRKRMKEQKNSAVILNVAFLIFFQTNMVDFSEASYWSPYFLYWFGSYGLIFVTLVTVFKF